MPTYEYMCKSCGQIKEFTFPMGKRLESILCDCGPKKIMYRHYTPPGITFNGPGFYKTGG